MVLTRPSEYLPVTKTYNAPAYLYGHVSAAIILPDAPLQVFPPICEDVTTPPACKVCSTAQPHWSPDPEHRVDLPALHGSVF